MGKQCPMGYSKQYKKRKFDALYIRNPPRSAVILESIGESARHARREGRKQRKVRAVFYLEAMQSVVNICH